ncbi:hypothetical protein [Steroidobacter sp.]|uniref:hypothetical protein n=1 Tax=Steroidobacter sp. TaxID=1978227 RepID=UPI001A4DF1AF|nr:hypothetical protein [Steroidobacter sp.]MBL8266411.1 hypothetical protein [Steroidobacter sp.]
MSRSTDGDDFMMAVEQARPSRSIAAALYITLALVLLGAMYPLLRKASDDEAARAPEAHTFRIDISADSDTLTQAAQSGVPVFKARQGDTITLVATSTQPGSLHVHVYDRSVPLVQGSEVMLTFPATTAGAFPIHWHDPQNLMIHMAILEVQPR